MNNYFNYFFTKVFDRELYVFFGGAFDELPLWKLKEYQIPLYQILHLNKSNSFGVMKKMPWSYVLRHEDK